MGGFLSRTVELVNDTIPGVVIELTEVEKGERPGTPFLKLQPGERKKIKATQFINRHRISRVPRTIHAAALVSAGKPPKTFLSANDFAVNGKLVFRLVEEELTYDAEVIPDLRRVRIR